MKDYYSILGIGKNASNEEIKEAHKISLDSYADKNDLKWEKRFYDINEAYNTLIDNENRIRYDKKLAEAKNWNTFIFILRLLIFAVMILKLVDFFNKSSEKENSILTPNKLNSDSTSSAPNSTALAPSAPDSNGSTKNLDNLSTMLIPSDFPTVFDVKWTKGATEYRAALILQQNKSDGLDSSGIMRVKYFVDGQPVLIEETMKVLSTKKGDYIKGLNPLLISGTSSTKYTPDILFISEYDNGKDDGKNVDEAGNTYPISMIPISGESEEKKFLAYFQWQPLHP